MSFGVCDLEYVIESTHSHWKWLSDEKDWIEKGLIRTCEPFRLNCRIKTEKSDTNTMAAKASGIAALIQLMNENRNEEKELREPKKVINYTEIRYRPLRFRMSFGRNFVNLCASEPTAGE